MNYPLKYHKPPYHHHSKPIRNKIQQVPTKKRKKGKKDRHYRRRHSRRRVRISNRGDLGRGGLRVGFCGARGPSRGGWHDGGEPQSLWGLFSLTEEENQGLE